ncbi:MAG: hypothetical protein ABSB65_05290 [Candidatus Acidiferrales bacterium]|jgi:hypothetical protein
MSRATLWIVLLSVCALGVAGCGSSGHLAVTITTAPTTLAVGATANLIATVTNDHNNAGVTWACQPSVACGAFSFNPDATTSGTATVFTAPPAIPNGTSVTITATSVANTARSASVTITITASSTATNNFVFYASGVESATGNVYSIAGVVAISSDGNNTVIGGEQDYNDGAGGITSPQPSGDFISGGTLTINANGQATLTLITNNAALGPSGTPGTETFALAYTSSSHALIIQFDGSATSSGSFDQQSATIATPVSASFSFTDSGADNNGAPVVDGGVFTLDGSSNATGFYDTNDAGTVTLDNAIPAGVSAGPIDSLGRGNLIGGLAGAATINYYVVGPEVLRSINVDTTDTTVGSAYGQGDNAGSFSAASIGPSAFELGSGVSFYGADGQFTTGGTSAFSGIADVNESVLDGGPIATAAAFNGSYTMAGNGYGSMTFTTGPTTDVTAFGIYAVDPGLNILDPNNTTTTASEGGALIAELDTNLVGTGVLVPQEATPDFGDVADAYAFIGNGDTGNSATGAPEFDFLGEGTIDAGAFSGTGALSDPQGALTTTDIESPNATFTGTFTPDGGNIGRSTTSITVASSAVPPDFTVAAPLGVTAYESNGALLFWLETDDGSFFVGSVQANLATDDDAKPAKPRPNSQKR